MTQLNFQDLRQTAFVFTSSLSVSNQDKSGTGHPTTVTITTGTSSLTC